MNENLLKIEENIKQNNKEHRCTDGWKYATNLLRATLTVDALSEIWDAYLWIKNSSMF